MLVQQMKSTAAILVMVVLASAWLPTLSWKRIRSNRSAAHEC
jgi:hypothetical protein